MRASLANVTTGDSYADAATLRLPGTRRIVFQTANAAVIYQLDTSPDGRNVWGDDLFLGPTVGSFDRACSGIRFRSAVAGTPAQVSVELLDADELAGGADAISPQAFNISSTGEIEAVVSVPTGTVVPYAGSGAPADEWLLCDGSAVSRTDYARLFAVIGTTFGAGDGSTTFNLPDMRGRMPVGVGSHADVNAVGDTDGTALASRRPKHNHTLKMATGAAGASGQPSSNNQDTTTTQTAVSVGPQTGAEPVDGPAYLTLNFLIRT